jgi:carbamoyl-phosphate synthase small subunit
VLEDGRAFRGSSYGAMGDTVGEAVFATGMTGYQETLTDPSYHGQVVVMTAPHVGNTGVNGDDPESGRMWLAGFVVRDPARRVSSWRATHALEDELVAQGIVGICDIDTRALTLHLRDHGAMRVGVFSGAAAARPLADLLRTVTAAPGMLGAEHATAVTTPEPYVVRPAGPVRFRVTAVDLGVKSATPRHLAALGVETTIVPATTTAADVLAGAPDGIFLSNGPGDPATADAAVALAAAAMAARVPLFGICFGHQVVGRALGLDTYKLRFGHRGINVPVIDRETGRVEVSAHNHGFAVQAPPGARDGSPFPTPYGRAAVSHVCLNDGVTEGLRCLDVPAFSVQYHPEAAAGPHDSSHLFGRFVDLMAAHETGAEGAYEEAARASA